MASLLAAVVAGVPWNGTPSLIDGAYGQSATKDASAPSPKTEIWFAPPSTIERPAVTDYWDLFKPDAPWPTAAKNLRVFEIGPGFMRKSSDAELSTVIDWTAKSGVGLALTIGLVHPQPSCLRTEGFDTDQEDMARRIARLGGRIAYVAADEPFYFGHAHDAPNACRFPVADLARDVAGTAKMFRSIFPGVKIAEDEPISNFKDPNWTAALGEFLADFRADFGGPMAAVRLDIAWWQPWQRGALDVTNYLRGIGQPFGVIYNGNSDDRTDAQWLRNARMHYQDYEALVSGVPDEAVFQTWVTHPTRLLPETDPDALTHLIAEYVLSHPDTIMKHQ